MTIYFITGNENKFKEANEILNTNLEQIDIDLTEIQELDAKAVIRAKLLEATKLTNKSSFIIEDTSLYFEGLNNMPGPLIKWFLKSVGNEGLYKMAKTFNNYKATATTYIGYLQEDEIKFFKGEIKGTIVEPQGENGFGWDKIFVPEGFNKTFAQMTDDEKNSLSMRKLAFEELREEIKINN